MPPVPPPAMPPKGGPPAPPMDAEPPDAQAFAEQAAADIGAKLPAGEFTEKGIKRLVDATNSAIPKLLGDAAPDGKMEAPKFEGGKIEGPAPVPLVLPALILLGEAAKVDPKYAFDVAGLVDDDALRDLGEMLTLAAKDKRIVDALAGAHEEPDADDMGGPSDNDADNKPGAKKGPPPPPPAMM